MIATVNGTEVAHKVNPLPHHRAGLTWTATGYGARIPTVHMVKFRGIWRRVYAAQFANVGTLYVGKRAAGLFVELQA